MATAKSSATPLRELKVGDIVVPYQSGKPIMIFDNGGGTSWAFIRARYHEGLNVWYSDIDPNAVDGVASVSDPAKWKPLGAIVFLMELTLKAGQGISIRKVAKNGSSAHGVSVPLTQNIVYPYDVDARVTFKSLSEE